MQEGSIGSPAAINERDLHLTMNPSRPTEASGESVTDPKPRIVDSAARATTPDGGVTAVLRALDGMVASAQPEAMFANVARLCVPLICDAAMVAIHAAGQRPYSISWPAPLAEALPELSEHRITADSVLVPITPGPIDGEADYRGVLALRFHSYRPGPAQALLGQLVVERAVSQIRGERIAGRLALETSRADNLELALTSSREIGVAMGIAMDRYKLSTAQAFDLLRRISQHANRKIRDIAADIVATGAIEVPPADPGVGSISRTSQDRTHARVGTMTQ
jgi:hypothetical protein